MSLILLIHVFCSHIDRNSVMTAQILLFSIHFSYRMTIKFQQKIRQLTVNPVGFVLWKLNFIFIMSGRLISEIYLDWLLKMYYNLCQMCMLGGFNTGINMTCQWERRLLGFYWPFVSRKASLDQRPKPHSVKKLPKSADLT